MVQVIRKNKSKTLRQQLTESLNKISATPPKRKWSSFFGKVHFGKDPIAYQRKLRNEQ